MPINLIVIQTEVDILAFLIGSYLPDLVRVFCVPEHDGITRRRVQIFIIENICLV